MTSEFSHIDGNTGCMVDISQKNKTLRVAHARCSISLPPEIMKQFNDNDIEGPKGPVFNTAKIAGIMAVKNTFQTIPLCHQISIEGCDIEIKRMDETNLVIDCRVTSNDKTGVEMEALTGVSTTALTIYDMCKALSHNMTINGIMLVEKSGGKNDFRG